MIHPTATVVNIQRFSTEDGPGIRTTVFFKGCPMRCPWCHNPETVRFEPEVVWHRGRCLGDGRCVEVCPSSAISSGETGIVIDRRECTGCGQCAEFCPSEALEIHGRAMALTAIVEHVNRDRAFYRSSGGGVTLSGGEPLTQSEAAIGLLRLLKGAELHVALDTCGAASPSVLEEALDSVDLVLFDVKTVDPVLHEQFTGFPFQRVAAAADIVNQSQKPVWIRTPVIPGYTDDEDGIRATARFVRETFDCCERHDLLAFSNLCSAKYDQLGRAFVLATAELVSREKMEFLADAAQQEGSVNVHWSGPTRVREASA